MKYQPREDGLGPFSIESQQEERITVNATAYEDQLADLTDSLLRLKTIQTYLATHPKTDQTKEDLAMVIASILHHYEHSIDHEDEIEPLSFEDTSYEAIVSAYTGGDAGLALILRVTEDVASKKCWGLH